MRTKTIPGRPVTLVLVVLLVSLLIGGCDEETVVTPPVTMDLAGTFAILKGSSPSTYIIGWAMIPDSMTRESETYNATYHLPGPPWRDLVEIEYSFPSAGVRLDRTLGPVGGGDATETRLQREGDHWAWLLHGWGELDMVSDLLPAEEEPVVLDPYSPLPPILMGWRWHDAGRPDTLDLTVLIINDSETPPEVVSGHLTFEGKVNEDSRELLSFDLEVGSFHYYFKLISDQFPAPYRTWWERYAVGLNSWVEVPNVDDQLFAPNFPAVDGYSVEQTTITVDDLDLAAEILTPDGDGPFPAVLLVADRDPADRNDAAVAGHLAHHLARGGYLVLRHDKPGTGASPGRLERLDLALRRQTIAAAWDTLRTQVQVDTTRCYILGRGEGGAMALERASTDAQDQVKGVIALAPTLLDPTRIRPIPLVDQSAAPIVTILGREVFTGKYRDRRQIDSNEFLGDVTCPVALFRGEYDDVVVEADFTTQGEILEIATADLTQELFTELNHYLTRTRADAAPHQDAVSAILDWLATH